MSEPYYGLGLIVLAFGGVYLVYKMTRRRYYDTKDYKLLVASIGCFVLGIMILIKTCN